MTHAWDLKLQIAHELFVTKQKVNYASRYQYQGTELKREKRGY
jgi:hypothetical protein